MYVNVTTDVLIREVAEVECKGKKTSLAGMLADVVFKQVEAWEKDRSNSPEPRGSFHKITVEVPTSEM